MAAPSYRFALTPRWIAGHVIALVAIVAFASLGMWQLRRLDDRREMNTRIEARLETAASPLDEVLARWGDDPEVLEYRRVSISGTYSESDQVLLRAQAYNGAPGFHVLTPMRLSDQSGLVIERGWIPLSAEDATADYAPQPGEVFVEGIVRRSEQRGAFGPVDPAEGVLDIVSRVDLERLAAQVEVPLRPYYLQLIDQQPRPDALPVMLAPPALSEGPHLGYAVQWFAFAGVVLVGYPILLRVTARRGDGSGDGV